MKLPAIAILLACSLLPAASRAAEVVSAETSVTTIYKRCSAIHGARFRLSEGGEVGTIEDIIFDPAEGRIVTVITSYEGRYVPVPWTVISVGGPEEKIVTVNVTRETFINAPTIERTNITNITTLNPQILQRSDTFFRERVTTRESRTNGTVRTQEGSGAPPSGNTRLQTDTSVGTETGTRMKNPPGTKEGRRETNPTDAGQGNRVKGRIETDENKAQGTGTSTQTHKDIPDTTVSKPGRKGKNTEESTIPSRPHGENSTGEKGTTDAPGVEKTTHPRAEGTTEQKSGKHADQAKPGKKHPGGDSVPVDPTKKGAPDER